MSKVRLPEAYKEFEQFSCWALATETERNRKRLSSTMEDIHKFYETMLSRIDEVLQYLDTFALENLPEPETNLLNMALSLAEVANAVELFKTKPGVIDGFPAERFPRTNESAV